MELKRIAAMNESTTAGRSRTEAQQYWAASHGTLNSNIGPNLKRYHHYFSLPEAYESDPKPTHMGITMYWSHDPFRDFYWQPDPNAEQLVTDDWIPWRPDDIDLFDRRDVWPLHEQRARLLAEEHIIIDAEKHPGMVNALIFVSRLPGLRHRDFFAHWSDVHAPLVAKLPGLRRYIQNRAALDQPNTAALTHDGCSEFWFDDFASFQRAVASPEWQAMETDGRMLFCEQKSIVIGHEYVQKDESWKLRDYGALSMTEDQIRARLLDEGYKALLDSDPGAPAKIKAAAQKGKLGVWTTGHLVTMDESRIDVRPAR